ESQPRLLFAAPYPLTVAQIFNLPYRRFVIGRASVTPETQDFAHDSQVTNVTNLRYSPARPSRNQHDPTTDEHGWTRIRESLVFIRVNPCPSVVKKSSRAATIPGDTNRLQVCPTSGGETVNTYSRPRAEHARGCTHQTGHGFTCTEVAARA